MSPVRRRNRLGDYAALPMFEVYGPARMTLPDRIRRKARLDEGDYVEVSMQGDAIVLRPKKVIEASQAWFWDARWQSGEREASGDIAEGRTTAFGSDEAFLESLD
jgi:AbrB family looped-hinge helix DNA binding protein